jgi:hypothetical protein
MEASLASPQEYMMALTRTIFQASYSNKAHNQPGEQEQAKGLVLVKLLIIYK